MKIERQRFLDEILVRLRDNPVCALLGPRQCGKTTLARDILGQFDQSHYFDLERNTDIARLSRPESTLGKLDGLVVIDEIQRMPELFTVLRPFADRPDSNTRFLILGSAAPETVRGASETLAGRISFVDLSGFSLEEVGAEQLDKLWLRGGFPRSFLADNAQTSLRWREDFIRTFLEQDIPQLGIRIPAATLRRFWMMVAHYHGNIWNGSELASALGTNERTTKRYLDILTGTFMLRQLQPWYENMSKRQIKSAKIYVRDSGLLHALFDLADEISIQSHPKYGTSWEGFAIEQICSALGSQSVFFWGTQSGAELDLLFFRNGLRYGVEFKVSDTPAMTKSLHIALSDLNLEHAWIVHPGQNHYSVHDKVDVVSLPDLLSLLRSKR